MRRICVALSSALFMLTALAIQASAGPWWCEEDPVFVVNGNVIDVTTTFSSDNVSFIEGPIYFLLQVPSNTAVAAVVSVDGTVPVRGYVSPTLPPASVLEGSPAVLRVWMNASESFPIYTKITGITKWGTRVTLADTVVGSSTRSQQVRFTLPLP